MKHVRKDIGIKQPKNNERLIFLDAPIEIFTGAYLSSRVSYKETVFSDKKLYVKQSGKVVKDHFDHEIYLVLSEADKSVLFTGCSHKGIENIIAKLEKELGKSLTHVIGGFHLSHYDKNDSIHKEQMDLLGEKLNNRNTEYFACHCTGEDAFADLSKHMKKLHSLHTGEIIEI